MISRWFIFWIAMFTIYSIKGNDDLAILFLIFAILSTDPIKEIEDMLKKDKKNG